MYAQSYVHKHTDELSGYQDGETECVYDAAEGGHA